MENVVIGYIGCPIRHVISRFGDKWSMLVLYELNQSKEGKLRYSELSKKMLDCSQKMLSATLRNLEENGLVRRTVHNTMPIQVDYSLTEVGQSLMPHINGLIDWARQNMSYFKEKPLK